MEVTQAEMYRQIGSTREQQKTQPACQLKEEIDRKGAQLYGLPYIAIEYSREQDYDRYWSKKLRLLKGFSYEYAAIFHVDELADTIRKSLLAEDAMWQEDESWQQQFAVSHDDNDLIRCAYTRGFEYYSHRLWETKRINFEVLHLQDPERLEQGLCTYFPDEFLKDPTGPYV